MTLRFLFVGEGKTDRPLVAMVESIALGAGAERVEAHGDVFGHDPVDRIRRAALFDPGAHLYVVHRDADRAGLESRWQETMRAADECGLSNRVVPCIPVREMEAWLLLDDAEIRRVVGNPRGREPLGLPNPNRVEEVADPKSLLDTALLAAAEATRRRRQSAERNLEEWKRVMLEGLDVDGPVSAVPSFVRFRSELGAAVRRILDAPAMVTSPSRRVDGR